MPASNDDIYALLQIVDGKVDTLQTDVTAGFAAVDADLTTIQAGVVTLADAVAVNANGLAFIHSLDRQDALYPNGQQNVSDLNVATALTVPAGTVAAYVVAETEAVRYTADGTTPTSSVGVKMVAGQGAFFFSPAVVAGLQFINAQANDATLSVIYFK